MKRKLLLLWTFLLCFTAGVSAQGSEVFNKISSLDELTDGEYLIVANDQFAMGTFNGEKTIYSSVEVTASGGAIADPGDAVVATIAKDSDGKYTIFDGTGYVVSNGNNNQAKQAADIASASHYTVTYDAENGVFKFADNLVEGRYLQYNLSSPRFAHYLEKSKQTNLMLYKKGAPAAVSAPSIDGISPFIGSTTVTLACETTAATIYYTLDGTDPTAESTQYTAPFTLTESATVKAIAISGSNKSSIVSKSFVAVPSYADLASVVALENDTEFGFTGNVVVVACPTNYYCYIKDNTGHSLIHSYGEIIEVGKTLAPNWTGKIAVYNNLIEIKPTSTLSVLSADAETVTYPEATVADVTAANMNKVVVLKGVTYTAPEGRNFTIAQGEVSVAGYNQFELTIDAPVEGKTYDIVGAISVYKENAQFQPISITESVAAEPEAPVWRDIKIDLTAQGLLTDEEYTNKTNVEFGLKVAEDGTVSRVAADDATANAVISGKYHNDHGWTGVKLVVPVQGNVKIGVGNCTYQGHTVGVTDNNGNTVTSFNPAKNCWKNSKDDAHVTFGYYIGGANTLTIKADSYTPYLSVQSIVADFVVTYYNEAYTTADATYTKFAEIPYANGETITIVDGTPQAPAGKKFAYWATAEGTKVAGGETAANMSLYPVWEDAALVIGEKVAIVKPEHVYTANGCVTKGDNQLIDSSGDGAYILFDVLPEVSGDYTFTSMIGTTNAGMGVTMGYVNEAGEFVKSEKKDIENSGDWNNGPDYTWTFSLTAGQVYTFKVLCHSDQRYCVNVFEMKVKKSAATSDESTWRDIKVDVYTLATEEEKATQGTEVSFGIAIDAEGNATRVAADATDANAVFSGKYHSDHGFTDSKMVVKVEGPVKVGIGNCTYGGHTAKFTTAESVTTEFETGASCFKNDAAQVTYAYYKGEATTLTINGASYTRYFSVEKVALEDIPSNMKVTYAIGESGATGVAPAGVEIADGKTFAIPVNKTLYVEGKTLTGWTDGTNTYAVGQEVTAVAGTQMDLTPVFTANEVALADRTEAVTLTWDFQQKNGAPVVAWQGTSGHVWVAQATIGGKTIDVKCDIDATNGKVANANWQDWAQLNGGTKITIPSCKGAVVSVAAYNALGTGEKPLTIDGQSDYTSAQTISYEIANKAETIDVVIGDEGSYYRYVQVVLPVVEQSAGGKTYTNEAATVVWPFNDATDATTAAAYTATPAEAFSTVNTDLGDLALSGTGTGQAKDDAGKAVTFIKLTPSGTTQAAKWEVKPAAGLTFTPTKVSMYIQRFGTDAENGVTVTALLANGTSVELGNYTAPRNNKSQADDKFGASANYTNKVEIDLTAEQQSKLASTDGFAITATVGVSASKQGGFSDVQIHGLINGTAADVAKYTLATAVAPAEGGTVNVYPVAEQYEEGTEVTLTATEKFGYDFVNWTDAAGTEVSAEAKFKYTVNADETLTANFKQVNTYELAITVEGGANDYMVSLNPAPTVVDGKNMYEEGTKVALAAASNAILTFSSWSNGQTSSEIEVDMTENVALTANYSAVDYIVGWDFYKRGNNGRVADFYSTADNEAAALILTNASGSVVGWLDKSTEAANGYESMKGAAVNWQKIGDKYYYQTKINASEFTDIKVQAQMLYNYIAHKTQVIEYSVDGTNWKEAGRATMPAVKTVTDIAGTLGEDANNAAELYIRFIPDYTSDRDGSGDGDASNDGTAITNIFVTGAKKLVDDGKAPALVSTVPATGATGASANGRVVLNFDEKVKLTSSAKATLNGEELALSVAGKTVTAEYKNLAYATDYTFQLAGGSVSDLTDNVLGDAITVTFTTMTRPTVDKALYDFIVPDDGNFKDALNAASTRADKSKRYRIFVKQGSHIIPANQNAMVTGSDGKSYPDPKTSFGAPNTSIIGEEMALTSVANTMPNDLASNPDAGAGGQANPLEGIRTSGLLYMTSGATNTYFQDITLKTNTPDATGRNVILVDGGNKTICKDVTLWAYQDTYVSDRSQSLYYFEGGVIRGRTDFICGSGDVFFNDVDIVMCEQGGYIVAPRANVKYGYVFKDCTLKGEQDNVNGNYFLGRPWTEAAETYYIDCTMEAIPTAAGWTNMSAGGCTRFAEYNSVSASGTTVDLSGRVKTLGNENPHSFNPVLSAEEAAEIGNMSNMFGDWNPRLATEQAPAPTNVIIDGTTLAWDNSEYALCWAVCKDGKVVAFTTEPTYTVDDATAKWSVRAANEMGGLCDAVEAAAGTVGIENIEQAADDNAPMYNVAGQRVTKSMKGIIIQNGRKYVRK